MNRERYKQRLLEMEQTLSGRIGREADQGRDEFAEDADVVAAILDSTSIADRIRP